MLRKVFLAALAAVLMASSANAAMILGIKLDPTTTAGAGATSTRSSPGSRARPAATTSRTFARSPVHVPSRKSSRGTGMSPRGSDRRS